jgi:hypothetical protein
MLIEAGPLSCAFQAWRRADGRVFAAPFALDIETTRISGHEVPDYVLGAACDGTRGFFLPPAQVHDFLVAHWGTGVVLHNAPFDLGVLHALFHSQGRTLDVYDLVDRNLVWDTLLLHRLHGLATQGHTHEGVEGPSPA